MNNNNLETLFDRIGLPKNSDTRVHAAGLIEALVDQKVAESRKSFAQGILDRANKHAQSVGLWGAEAAALAMMVMSGKASKRDRDEHNVQVTERRALLVITDIVNEELEAQLNPQKPGEGEV